MLRFHQEDMKNKNAAAIFFHHHPKLRVKPKRLSPLSPPPVFRRHLIANPSGEPIPPLTLLRPPSPFRRRHIDTTVAIRIIKTDAPTAVAMTQDDDSPDAAVGLWFSSSLHSMSVDGF